MTALNVWIKPKAGYVVTDTAQYSPEDGRVLGFTAKAIGLPSLRMILAASGMLSLTRLGEELDRHPQRTQADVKAAIPKVIRTLSEANERDHPALAPEYRAITIKAVCWNRLAKRAEVSVCATDAEHLHAGLEPWRLYTGRGSLLHPDLEDGEGFSRLDPETEAVGVLQRQREQVRKTALNGARFPIVGGRVHLLKVNAVGVEQAILHEWPDKVGEVIGSK